MPDTARAQALPCETGAGADVAGDVNEQWFKPFLEPLSWIGGSWALVPVLYFVLHLYLPAQFPTLDDVRERLADPKNRKSIRDELERPSTWLERYRAAIGRLNGALDRFFGEGLWHWRVFERSLTIALVYPVVLFFLGWLFGGSGKIGAMTVFPDAPALQRWLSGGVIVAFTVFLIWYFSRNIPQKVADLITARLRSIWPDLSPGLLSTIDGLIYIGVVVGVGVGVISGIGLIDLTSGVGVGVGVFGVVVFGVVVVGVFGVVVGVGVLLVRGLGNESIVFAIFYILLPIVNALFDYLSWIATRYFLRKAEIADRHHGKTFFLSGHIIADAFIAFMCLFGLAFVSGLTLETASLAIEYLGLPPLRWQDMMVQAINAPFPSGLLMIGMLLTTLAPTLLHLVAGLAAILAMATPGAHAHAARITDDIDAESRQIVAAYYFRRAIITFVPAAVLCTSLLAAIGYAAFNWKQLEAAPNAAVGASYYLIGTAHCGAAVVRGACPLWPNPEKTPKTAPKPTATSPART